MESLARNIALHLSLVIEILGALVIAIGLLQLLWRYGQQLFAARQRENASWLRVQFGGALTLSLELLLAADILRTAVAPTWEEIGKLAAIASIRTALNFFLEKELKQLKDTEE